MNLPLCRHFHAKRFGPRDWAAKQLAASEQATSNADLQVL
jgi:hypothetical protein